MASTPEDQLAKLKGIARHLLDAWPPVLQKWVYIKTLGRDDGLRKALSPSRAANVHNTMQDVLALDMFRELGALILDEDPRSASVASALRILRSPEIMELIYAAYQVPYPTHVRGLEEHPPEMQAEILEVLRQGDLEKHEGEFRDLRGRIEGTKVLARAEAGLIVTARNKGVAHYDIQKVEGDWKLWRVGGTGLTYGALEEYLVACTEAVETVVLFVLRTSFDFAESAAIADKNVAEYVEALTAGMNSREKGRKPAE